MGVVGYNKLWQRQRFLVVVHVLYELDCYKNIQKAMIMMFINTTKFWNDFIVLPHNEREVGNFIGNIVHNSNNSV